MSTSTRPPSSPLAFTLIELVVVLVVLGVLAALTIPTFASLTEESRQRSVVLSAEALAAYGDAWAASVQIPAAALDATFHSAACDDMPGCGDLDDGVTLNTSAGQTTFTRYFGGNPVCATITWGTSVGQLSTVAASACPGGPSVTTVCSDGTTDLSATWDLGTYTFADGWEVAFSNFTGSSLGAWPYGGVMAGTDYCAVTVSTTANSDTPGGVENWVVQLEAGGTVYSTTTILTGAGTEGDTYNLFPSLYAASGSGALNLLLVPGEWNGSAWVPLAGQTALQIGTLSFGPTPSGVTWVDATIAGTITGTDGACQNATVSLYTGASVQVTTTTTDVSGAYSITFTEAMGPPDTYFVTVTPWLAADGFSYVFGQNIASATVTSGANVTADLTHASYACP